MKIWYVYCVRFAGFSPAVLVIFAVQAAGELLSETSVLLSDTAVLYY